MAEYNFREIEHKWQQDWKEKELYKVSNTSDKPKYYILDMFPYPSGAGLHVGHPLGYIASDIVARYKRLQGFNVLHPMGYDSFGLPTENYAAQTGQHPATTTKVNINGGVDNSGKKIKGYRAQLDQLGFSFDWSREVRTSDPSFYKWTQWIFKLIYNSWYNQASDKAEPIETLIEVLSQSGNGGVKAACDEDTPQVSSEEWNGYSEKEQQQFLLKYRLTYLAETTVNWCPELGTVLSNDEVKDGFSVRGGNPVVKKKMPQWSMRITAYCDRLIKGLDTIEWPEAIKEIQRNWIGKSVGAELDFAIDGHQASIQVFTTRIDTIYGATFCVLAPEHELIGQITTPEQKAEVDAYVTEASNRSERDRMSDVKTVTGVFTGAYAINPFTNESVPIWTADYVLAGYGTGAVMAVPAHDDRDHRFAKKFGIPIVQVIAGDTDVQEEAFVSKDAKVMNSGFLDGLQVNDAIEKAVAYAEEKAFGTGKVNFRLRDSVFGRQRYWGEPIPVYYKEGVPHLVDDENLPLNLPEVSEYLPTEDGYPPLGRATDWNHKGDSYELSTMPGWAGSSWYFFRYMDPNNENEFCSKKALDYWGEVDFYLGGSEHATGHLLYSRFWTKFLHDRGYIQFDEYAKKLVNQGMIQSRSNFVFRVKGENKYVSLGLKDQFDTQSLHADVTIVNNDILDVEAFKKSVPDAKNADFVLEDGKYICGWETEKMSKSKYNVVNPDDLVVDYGADTMRMYEMFLGPIEQSKPWNTNGIDGVFKFLRKFWNLFHDGVTFHISDEEPIKEELKILHGLIKKIEEDCESLSLNTSVSAFMIAVNELGSLKCNKRAVLEPMTVLLSPFAPHIAEELYQLLGNEDSVVNADYPEFEAKHLVEDSFEYPVSINGKMRVKLSFPSEMDKDEIEAQVLANDIVQKWTEGKPPKKVIVVTKRIVNVVV